MSALSPDNNALSPDNNGLILIKMNYYGQHLKKKYDNN